MNQGFGPLQTVGPQLETPGTTLNRNVAIKFKITPQKRKICYFQHVHYVPLCIKYGLMRFANHSRALLTFYRTFVDVWLYYIIMSSSEVSRDVE